MSLHLTHLIKDKEFLSKKTYFSLQYLQRVNELNTHSQISKKKIKKQILASCKYVVDDKEMRQSKNSSLTIGCPEICCVDQAVHKHREIGPAYISQGWD